MSTKWIIIAIFALLMAGLYALCMCAVPRKGWLHVVETVCTGIILSYLCSLAAQPFGLQIAQSPLAALTAGFLGIPGAALSTFIALWP